MTAPIASGWSGCRVGLAPTGKRRLCTAHAKYRQSLPKSVTCLLRGNVGWIGLVEIVIDHLPGAAKVPAIHSDGDRRDLRLDACRGLALWFIFIDHIPDNALAWLTLRNYGFSDTTEVFVFVSGYTCMLAYGGALREQGGRRQ